MPTPDEVINEYMRQLDRERAAEITAQEKADPARRGKVETTMTVIGWLTCIYFGGKVLRWLVEVIGRHRIDTIMNVFGMVVMGAIVLGIVTLCMREGGRWWRGQLPAGYFLLPRWPVLFGPLLFAVGVVMIWLVHWAITGQPG